jgi:hypothetical protein
MAYVYAEERIVSGEVPDPRPINRTLARYYAEFDGMLDRDNFEVGAFTSPKVAPISGTNGQSTVSLVGPCRQLKAWRASTTQSFLAGVTPCQYVQITGDVNQDFGGTIVTLDSALSIDFSCWYHWWDESDGGGAPNLGHAAEFYVTVDGLTVDTTGPVYVPNTSSWVYLCPYVPVGAGSHSVHAWAKFYNFSGGTLSVTAVDAFVNHRELIVKEVRR